MGRVDNRKSSSPNCSTVTIVVFVALCLVGLWMMTSSVVVPVGNVEMSPEETNAEVKKQVEIVNEPQQSEESLDGVVKDASTIPEVKQNVSPAEKMIEIQIEEVKEENSVKENEERKNIPNDVTGNGAGNESNGTLETAISKEPVEASKPETWGESNDTTKTEIASESDDSPRKEIVNESNDDSKIETRSDETLRKETANESNVDSRIETIIESDHTLGKETANESNNDSKTETGNESDNAFKKETGNESNDASKTETGNESDRALRKESLNESNDDSKTETGNESDRALKKESLNESNDDSKTEIGNESDETSKTEKKNERNEKAENEETNMESGEVDSKGKESNTEGSKTNENGQADGQDRGETNSESEESSGATGKGENVPGKIQEMVEQNQGHEYEQNSSENKTENQTKDQRSNEVFLDPTQSELLNETSTQNGAFSTQAMESKNEKEAQQLSSSNNQTVNKTSAGEESDNNEYNWKLCNATAAQDYIPCLDNGEAIKKLKTTKHYEHRERHCPEEGPTCLVPLPNGYKQPVLWPSSRDKIWYYNVPHTQLAQVKGHQNWVKYTGEFLTFPGGGTQFKHGALHYIDFIQESLPNIAWGRQSRVVLDVGCGVASFGGYLFERDVVTMSFAPKDEHEAQVQFALERGIPAISAVMGTKRLPFPSKVFDIVHCARCRVPWHIEGGKLLLELNRVIRPGGYFVWSATPVYQKKLEDVEIWNAMSSLTKSMCWDLMTKVKDPVNRVGIAVYKKPSSNHCYQKRVRAEPPLCEQKDDPDAAWNVPLQACVHQVPVAQGVHGSQWPEQWPQRLLTAPLWLNDSQVGVYGKPAPEDFKDDYKHWKHAVSNTYLNGMGIDWSKVRNVMDMRSVYGGFAAALSDLHMWVMNVVTIDSPDTLPIIYERGLFGIYHDWCESFSTYPRTYDLLHADHLFSRIKKRCELLPVIVEVDRILRPEGNLIVRDNVEILNEIEKVGRSLKWEIRLIQSKDNEGLLCMQKSMWRPQEIETSTSSVA